MKTTTTLLALLAAVPIARAGCFDIVAACYTSMLGPQDNTDLSTAQCCGRKFGDSRPLVHGIDPSINECYHADFPGKLHIRAISGNGDDKAYDIYGPEGTSQGEDEGRTWDLYVSGGDGTKIGECRKMYEWVGKPLTRAAKVFTCESDQVC
jgi:hypothetical protein